MSNPSHSRFIPGSLTSAIRSHLSYRPAVTALCYRSGMYLTDDERRRRWYDFWPLRELHHFPGVPTLDRAYQNAALATQEQHYTWSRPGLSAVMMLISASAILIVLGPIQAYRDQVGGALESQIFQGVTLAAYLLAVALIIAALILLILREILYHRREAARYPLMPDFPLLECTYDIQATEDYRVPLGNGQPIDHTRLAQDQGCRIGVSLYPTAASIAHYSAYAGHYQGKVGVNEWLFGGVVALSNLHAIDFTDAARPIEYGHRLVLRAPIPPALRDGTFGAGDQPLCTLATAYRVDLARRAHLPGPQQAVPVAERQWHFPLEFQPFISAGDSFKLQLRFFWRGDPDTACALEQCSISLAALPSIPVVSVARGRYDKMSRTIIWQNLALQAPAAGQAPEIYLEVQFGRALLDFQPVLTGSYTFRANTLLSGMHIAPDLIWDARGLSPRVHGDVPLPLIETKSTISGDLTVDVRRLSQEHEYTQSARLKGPVVLNQQLVGKVLKVLTGQLAADLQHVEQSAPRLDLSGQPQDQLVYWDITARKYHEVVLDPIDIHLVLSGDSGLKPARSTPGAPEPRPAELSSGNGMRPLLTEVEIYVRCLHDPRNTRLVAYADDLLIKTSRLLREAVIGLQAEPKV